MYIKLSTASDAAEQMCVDLRCCFRRHLAVRIRAEQRREELMSSLALCIVVRSRRRQRASIREFAHETPFPRRRREAIRDSAGASAPSAHAARFSTIAPASRRRPREIRLMTVPIGTAVISAIS